ncbi:MAG: ligase-associated DNA damage response endonuclease PdeM [Planctomycetota bacterium]|nr:ligase-associated DNA damage response endonuclease PdeM [Planctomycetota bacterium]
MKDDGAISMTERLPIELGGASLELLGGRGVWVPAAKTLLVADAHLGKEATFRRHQIPIPAGATTATLGAVTKMLQETDATRFIILGDMFHARSSLSPDVCASLEAFFKRHPRVEMLLVRGNHDAHLGQLPSAWPIEIVSQFTIDDILLMHHPVKVPPQFDLMLCGHLHPAIRVETVIDRTGKLPCFWFSKKRLMLPAIGDFTGTHRIHPGPGDKAWLVVDGQIMEHVNTRKRRFTRGV